MARNRFFYAVFLIGCVLFSAAYKSRIASVLLVAAIVYPIAALLLTAVSVFPVRVCFDDKRGVHEKNEQFELPVNIINNFLFPYSPLELDCILPDNETGLFLRKQIYAAVAPLKKLRIFVPCMHCYRGSYTARIIRLSVFDPLRLIRISRKVDMSTQLVFLPRKIPLEQLGMIFGGDNGSAAGAGLTGEKEDFSHAREYADGDIMQLIHWKLSAKLDELMVKQYDSQADRRTVILCNFGRYGATPSAVICQSDAVIETAVAVAMSAVQSGVRAFADTGAYSGISCDIADSGGFQRFYELMSVLEPAPEVMEFPQLIDSYAAGSAAAMFLITPVMDEEIIAAAHRAGQRLGGTVVLIYVNCFGRTDFPQPDERSRFVFAQVSGEVNKTLPAAAEQILEDYSRLNE